MPQSPLCSSRFYISLIFAQWRHRGGYEMPGSYAIEEMWRLIACLRFPSAIGIAFVVILVVLPIAVVEKV